MHISAFLDELQELDESRAIAGRHVAERSGRRRPLASVPEDRLFESESFRDAPGSRCDGSGSR